MGGGSSSEQKPQEVNKEAYEQLQKQLNNSTPQQQNLNQSKVKQNTNPQTNIKNAPKNNQLPEQNQFLQDFQNNKIQPSNKNSNINPNRNKVNQKSIFINHQNDIFQKLPKSGQHKVGISMLKINPNQQFPHFTQLEQTESSYEATWSWRFDQREKKWNFTLEEPQSTGLSFVFTQTGQIIKGDPKKWPLLNHILSSNLQLTTKNHCLQQIGYYPPDKNSQSDSLFLPSIQTLEANKQKLYKAFAEEYSERFTEFQNHNKNQPIKNNKQPLSYQPYHLVKKLYDPQSKQWLLTSQIVEKQYQFSSWMVWKIVAKEKNQKILKLIEQQKRILQLRKQIYIHKMKAIEE